MVRRRSRPPVCRTAVVAALVLTLAGCGGSDEPAAEPSASPSTDPAVQECRDQWRALADEVEGEDGAGTPSGLASRWVTITAQVDYYAASGTAGDCEKTLAQERDTIEALQDFTDDLAPLDLELALSEHESDLASYARPAGRQGRAAPSAKQVAQALDDLRELAPEVTADQAAGWQQAAVTDLSDARARRRAVADLEVLSGGSGAFRRAERATAVLDRATRAVDDEAGSGTEDSGGSGD